MPRNVRNFWLELDVDGSKTQIAAGPQSKDGGFTLRIKMRDNGGIITPAVISGRALSDGRLMLEAQVSGSDPATYGTVR